MKRVSKSETFKWGDQEVTLTWMQTGEEDDSDEFVFDRIRSTAGEKVLVDCTRSEFVDAYLLLKKMGGA